MKIFLFGTMLLALSLTLPATTMARVNIDVSISLPPPIVFAAPPEVVVLPETYVYVVPDLDVDIYFYGGWWWRLWEGRWYRSRYYDSDWGYFQSVPSFYADIPSGWRTDFRNHRWEGHQWNYELIPHHQLQQNWKTWETNKHWEKQQTWGVQGLKPRTRAGQQSQTVRSKSQGKQQSREAAKPQQTRKVQPQQARPQSQPAKQQSREAAKPQQQRPQQHANYSRCFGR